MVFYLMSFRIMFWILQYSISVLETQQTWSLFSFRKVSVRNWYRAFFYRVGYELSKKFVDPNTKFSIGPWSPNRCVRDSFWKRVHGTRGGHGPVFRKHLCGIWDSLYGYRSLCKCFLWGKSDSTRRSVDAFWDSAGGVRCEVELMVVPFLRSVRDSCTYLHCYWVRNRDYRNYVALRWWYRESHGCIQLL